MKIKFGNKCSFTLIEIIVVASVISLLGTFGYSSLSVSNKNARDIKRKADLESIKPKLSVYYQVKGTYPASLEWNGDLVENGNTYLDNIPQDPLNGNGGYTYYYNPTTDGSFVLCTRLENNNDVYDIDSTDCNVDTHQKCNFCATLTGNYLAEGNALNAVSLEKLTCTGSCTGKCSGDSDGCNGYCTDSCNPTTQRCMKPGGNCCDINCTGKCTGGNDGCGGTCTNSCQTGYSCVSGSCVSNFPVGGITFIASSVVPSGYLECNGQSTSEYPALAAIVGGNVPDLKGKFIRVWNSGTGTSQSLDSGRTLLSNQVDDNKSHSHSYIRWTYGSQDGPDSKTINSGDIHYDWANTITSGTEFRPYNVALMAIIKY